MRNLIKLICFLFLVSCSVTKIDQKLLVGEWQSLNESPGIIINSNYDFLIILKPHDLEKTKLGADAAADTLSFKYILKGNIFTIYAGHLWYSKNKIIKLTQDSLIYMRKGDNNVFYFKRRKMLNI